MICSNGLLIGGLQIIIFIAPIVSCLMDIMNWFNKKNSMLIWSLIIGTSIVITSLISVDNVTYSYLWFGCGLLVNYSKIIDNDVNLITD